MARPTKPVAARSKMVAALFKAQEQRGFSGKDLEARSGVSDSNISLMRRGLRRMTVDELEWMAEALGLRVVLALK